MRERIGIGAISLWTMLATAGVANAATFVVDATVDAVDANPGDGVCATAAGDCTLRAAVMETNRLAGADVITLPAGLYLLTLGGRIEQGAATGDLNIADDLTIRGADRDTTVIDADGIDRVFHVDGYQVMSARLYDLTIRGGYALDPDGFGGGIAAGPYSRLALVRVAVTDNRADGMAGGVGLGDVSTISASPVFEVGAWASELPGEDDFSNLVVVDSVIARNEADEGGGGIAYVSRRGDRLLVSGTTISDNVDRGVGGGGILVSARRNNNPNGFEIDVLDSDFSANYTAGFGGALRYSPNVQSGDDHLWIYGAAVTMNTAALGGGGIAASASTDVTIERSLIADNVTDGEGGGLLLNGRAKIADTEIRGNTSAGYGGGVEGTDASRLTLERAAVAENATAGAGGGLIALGTADVFNTTISSNSAAQGGGVRNFALDETDGGDVYLANVTVAANSATTGAADLTAGANGAAIVARNTIVDSAAVACSGLVASLGHNIASDASCDFIDATDRPLTDPRLAPLADNGGPTRTHALEVGSPAIDAGAAADCAPTDQRGFARTGDCDVGAFEAGAEPICTDFDGDGVYAEGGLCGMPDCNDRNNTLSPAAPERVGDGLDNDCNALTPDRVATEDEAAGVLADLVRGDVATPGGVGYAVALLTALTI